MESIRKKKKEDFDKEEEGRTHPTRNNKFWKDRLRAYFNLRIREKQVGYIE